MPDPLLSIDKESSIPELSLPYGQLAHSDGAFMVGRRDGGEPLIFPSKPSNRQIVQLLGSSAFLPVNFRDDDFRDYIPIPPQTAVSNTAWIYGTVPITAVNTGTKTFTASANIVISNGALVRVDASASNNGLYTVVSSVPAASTTITVAEEIPSSVVDGEVDGRFQRTFINHSDKFPFCAHSVLLYARSFDGDQDGSQITHSIRQGGKLDNGTAITQGSNNIALCSLEGSSLWGTDMGIGVHKIITVAGFDPTTGQAFIDLSIQASTGVSADDTAALSIITGFFL